VRNPPHSDRDIPFPKFVFFVYSSRASSILVLVDVERARICVAVGTGILDVGIAGGGGIFGTNLAEELKIDPESGHFD
jgi:hypothetical protein